MNLTKCILIAVIIFILLYLIGFLDLVLNIF